MTKLATIVTSIALSAAAYAGGTSYGKGKGVTPPPPEPECPCHLTYSYLEAGWIRLDVDGVDDASNGGYVDAYYQVAPNFFVDGSATLLNDPNDLGLTVGAGGYVEVAKCVHLVGRAGYSYYDADEGGSEDAFYLSPGFRAQLGCNLEIYGKAYLEIGDEDVWSYGTGLVYHFCSKSALNVGVAFSEDAWSLQVGARYKF